MCVCARGVCRIVEAAVACLRRHFVQSRDKLMGPIPFPRIIYRTYMCIYDIKTHFEKNKKKIKNTRGNGGTGSDNRAVKRVYMA